MINTGGFNEIDRLDAQMVEVAKKWLSEQPGKPEKILVECAGIACKLMVNSWIAAGLDRESLLIMVESSWEYWTTWENYMTGRR